MTSPGNQPRVPLQSLSTGVPGLDEILDDGLPEYSFVLIAGEPGTGKTTLSQQMMFHLATAERPAVHFTVLGEPPLKMLRYQQQFSFFDVDALESRVHFVNMSDQALAGDLDGILAAITETVERLNPGVVVVDSFRTVVRAAGQDGATGLATLQAFLQRLALLLTSWQVTSFLVGEYSGSEMRDNPVFTISDGIIWLTQAVDRNSVVRKLQVVKMRGRASLPGLHTIRITDDGIQVFPRIIRDDPGQVRDAPVRKLSIGIPELDEMLGGGIPERDSVLIAGPAGSGKSTLTTHFIAAGLREGEPAVIAVFEERPGEYVRHAKAFGPDLDAMVARGLLELLYLRPLDLSVDEVLLAIQGAVGRTGARRLVIDSLSGFELALAPTFREEFRESLYRLVNALTGSGVTVVITAEVGTSFTDLVLTPDLVSFLADDIILQRFVELDGRLEKMMAVIKMRGSGHSRDLRLYEVNADGMTLGQTLSGYRGLIRGVAERIDTGPAADQGRGT